MTVQHDLIEISICAFTGPETSPIQRGQEAGYFADQGLSVRCEATPGSVHQMVGLIDGQSDMAMSAVDNVIAYVEGQGAATPKNRADLIVFMGSATDPRPLIARPEITSFADLKGTRIAVDAVATGVSFMLRQLLEDHGLGMGDYELVPVGGIKARWDAVCSGDCAAGLLGKAGGARASVTAIPDSFPIPTLGTPTRAASTSRTGRGRRAMANRS